LSPFKEQVSAISYIMLKIVDNTLAKFVSSIESYVFLVSGETPLQDLLRGRDMHGPTSLPS
jgi:hypothetical protein